MNINPNDLDELEDFISDVLMDSMDIDWTSRQGARAILRALEREELVIVRKS